MLASSGHPTAVCKHVLGGRGRRRGVAVAALPVGPIPGGAGNPGSTATAVATAVGTAVTPIVVDVTITIVTPASLRLLVGPSPPANRPVHPPAWTRSLIWTFAR